MVVSPENTPVSLVDTYPAHTRSAFSETMGRRTIYIASFALFLLFSILSAVSTNIAMFIVMRALGGGASASVRV